MNRARALSAAAALTLPLVLVACGGDDKGTSSSGASSADLLVTSPGIKFDANSYDLTGGGFKTIELKNNDGALPHTLLIEQNGKALDGFKLSAIAHKTDSGKVNLTPGTYTIYCDVVGHRAAGMEATLTVK